MSSALGLDTTAVLLQAASLLLDYPGADSEADLAAVQAALFELPGTPARRRLERFLRWWRPLTQSEREQTYVAIFDMDRDVSLHLTEKRPRTSRERGAALLELREAYRHAGVTVRRDELPDYLPLMLEVAAHAPACRALLAAERPALQQLAAVLRARDSRFALVLDAVLLTLHALTARTTSASAPRRERTR